MGTFLDVTLSRVPAGLDFAEPLRQLFVWVEEQGYVATDSSGETSFQSLPGRRNQTLIRSMLRFRRG